MSIYLFLCLCLGFSLQAERNFFVMQMINVGARFPKEVSKDWVSHLGEITHIGTRQLYLLGRGMANRYVVKGDFLKSFNVPSEVAIKAAYTNDNLTVASAYAYSRGLYPAGTGPTLINKNISRAIPPYTGANFSEYQKQLNDSALPHLYDTVPIMVEGGGPDYLLSATEYCTGLKVMVERRRESEAGLKDKRSALKSKADKAFKELKDIFGVDVKSLEDSMKYRDYIESAKYFAHDMSKPITADSKAALDNIYNFVQFEEYYDDPLVAQVVSNEVLKEVETALKLGAKNKKKMATYVVEDRNVYAMLKLVNKGEVQPVPFASLLEIRITVDENKKYFVRAYFNDKPLHWKEGVTAIDLDGFHKWIKENTFEHKAVSYTHLTLPTTPYV
eukprot:TRINITY_DN2553_c0_g1_i6.p1 TRINITY_DN2553_c0_g1~~TRINITY_DN2553_c0_g1_i6.p1  ORF type:complete len:388 (+),score=127.65 TRINITY_DN2553_c0_g1_i6:81-1244(+)